jgi:hypothetical protein
MRFVAATIGRNVKDKPMDPILWEQFKSELRQVMKEFAAREWEFTQELSGVGEWDGISEENYRFEMYFQTGAETHNMEGLKDILRTLGHLYQQDGIALLAGESEVI